MSKYDSTAVAIEELRAFCIELANRTEKLDVQTLLIDEPVAAKAIGQAKWVKDKGVESVPMPAMTQWELMEIAHALRALYR